MIGLLRAILTALERVLENQKASADQAAADRADLDAKLEHLRVLVEGDDIITKVGKPTFTPAGGDQ